MKPCRQISDSVKANKQTKIYIYVDCSRGAVKVKNFLQHKLSVTKTTSLTHHDLANQCTASVPHTVPPQSSAWMKPRRERERETEISPSMTEKSVD